MVLDLSVSGGRKVHQVVQSRLPRHLGHEANPWLCISTDEDVRVRIASSDRERGSHEAGFAWASDPRTSLKIGVVGDVGECQLVVEPAWIVGFCLQKEIGERNPHHGCVSDGILV